MCFWIIGQLMYQKDKLHESHPAELIKFKNETNTSVSL